MKNIKKEIYKSNCLKIGTIKPESHFYKNCDLTKSNNFPADLNLICKNCHKFYMDQKNKLRGKFIFKDIEGKRGTVKIQIKICTRINLNRIFPMIIFHSFFFIKNLKLFFQSKVNIEIQYYSLVSIYFQWLLIFSFFNFVN